MIPQNRCFMIQDVKTISLKLPGDLLCRLNRRTGPRQRSAFIRRAIEHELGRNGQKKKQKRDAANIAPKEQGMGSAVLSCAARVYQLTLREQARTRPSPSRRRVRARDNHP